MDAHSPKRMPSCSAALAPDRYQLRTELLACRSSGWVPHERACAAARAVDRTPHDHPAQQRPRMPYARPPCNGSRHVQYTLCMACACSGLSCRPQRSLRSFARSAPRLPRGLVDGAPSHRHAVPSVSIPNLPTQLSPRFELGARCVWVRPPAPAAMAASVRKGFVVVGRADPGGRRRGDLTRGTRR